MNKLEKYDIKIAQWMKDALLKLKNDHHQMAVDATFNKQELERQLKNLCKLRMNLHNEKSLLNNTKKIDSIKLDIKTYKEDLDHNFDVMNAISRRLEKLPV